MIPLTFILVIAQAFILVSQTHGVCLKDISVHYGRVEYGPTYYKVSCDPGYHALHGNSRHNGIVYCVRDEWETSPPSCSAHNVAAYGDRASGVDEQLQTDDSPCKNLGGCQHICKNVGGRAKCRCRSGYTLAEDGKRCIETPPEENGQSNDHPCHGHQCEHMCLIEKGRAQCRCRKGYILNKEDQRSCRKNRGPPVHPCEINNGGCDHKCTLSRSGRIVCSCREGFDLGRNKKSCIAATTAPERTSCDSNNGDCQYYCSMVGYNVQCSCPLSYKLDTDRKSCIATPRESCEVDNGGCEYLCLSRRNGGVVCSCPPGYGLADQKRCVGCRKNSYWSTEDNGCADCPANSFTLSEGKTSVRDCFCRQGYTGSPENNIPCLDNDECADNNFGCSHKCINTPGGAFCSCPVGFEVDKDNKTCIDIDECSLKNGGCEGLCINTNGSFYCRCGSGFVSSNKDIYSCDDVDECSENNGGCEQLCVNYRGGYYCICKEGYRLDGSLKNCTDISCPGLPLPHFSTKRCKRNAQVLPEMDNYPVGTVCNFKCLDGFKHSSDSGKMKCLEDGTWEGGLADCKAQRCPPLKVPENGDVHPSSCETEGNTVKQKCTFTCRQGYKLVGSPVFGCKNDLSWGKPIDNIPVCEPEGIRASVECFRDINATLLPGRSSHNVTIPEPVTNMESYEVFPKDVVVGKPMEFKAGKTKVAFTASSPSSNRTAKCVTTVHVIDEEPPVFLYCPKDILIEDAKVDGETVTWEDPEVTDNVEVESLTSSVVPNSTLAPGSYVVEYVARDAAGNAESCNFKIDVVRLSCDDLKDPVHGEANCMDWIYGRLCQPLCDDGYMRDPSESQFYSCGDSRVWEPSNKISDCLPYTEAVFSECPDGKELKFIEETDEEICLECPSNAVWSSTTRTCQETT